MTSVSFNENETTPEIQAELKNGLAVWYCKWCKKEHTHGHHEGYRLSHCVNPKSPYFKEIYYLRVKEAEGK